MGTVVLLAVGIAAGAAAGELGFRRSAAILTLVGTLFSRIAPPPTEDIEVEIDCSLVGGLNGL